MTTQCPITTAEVSGVPASSRERPRVHVPWGIAVICILAGVVYFFSAREPANFYDYPLRTAEAFLDGRIGFRGEPPFHLNEMIYLPEHDCYTSGFSLGQAITALPYAWMKRNGWIEIWHIEWLVALSVMAGMWWGVGLARHAGLSSVRSCWMAAALFFGTWLWTNFVAFDAWQVALGFSCVAQLGAIHALLVRRDPLMCGVWFAAAFAQRTEIVTLAPFFAWLWWHVSTPEERRRWLDAGIRFSLVPFVLGCLTLWYNYARFKNVADFGHNHVPHTLGTELYKYGIFAFEPEYWRRNFDVMFLKEWNSYHGLLGYVPDRFGSSIILASPVVLLLLRWRRTGTRVVEIISWLCFFVLLVPLYCHGDPGCGQYGYRYGITFLPWLYLILLRTCRPDRAGISEMVLIPLSIAICAYATYVFRFTKIGFEH